MSVLDRSIRRFAHPLPLRTRWVRSLVRQLNIGSFATRLRLGAMRRPHYGLCLYYAALQAKRLGCSAMTAVELGVAGGRGLLCMVDHAAAIRKELGIEILIAGFDGGSGLPASSDPRDLPYFWHPGAFPMDDDALRKRLAGRAELIVGDVAETCPRWSPRADAPLGMIAFDLDLYSSTRSALCLLEKENLLPRVWCYFDDIIDVPESCLTDFIGEAAAIRDFNRSPARERLHDNVSPARVFAGWPPEPWHNQIYLYHRLTHPQYTASVYERGSAAQLTLT